MNSEEFKIKLTIDNSGVKTGVNQAKKSISSLKEGVSIGGIDNTKAKASLEELQGTMENMRNLNFADMIFNNKEVSIRLKEAKKHLITFGDEIKLAGGYLNPFNKYLKEIKDGSIDLGSAWIMMKESGTSLKLAFNELRKATNLILTPMTKLAVALLAVGAAAYNTIKTANELKQVAADAAKIGLTANEYQQWGYILESVGVEANEITSFIKTLSDEQGQLAEGSEGASKAFEKLGLSVAQVVEMNQSQLFSEVVERLQNVENGVERTRLAYQIFGEDAAHLANVMNMSTEQMRNLVQNYELLGGAASANLVNKSKELSQSISNLKQAWTGLTNVLAEVFMPVVQWVVNGLTKIIAIVRMFLQVVFGLDSSKAKNTTTSMTSGMSGYKKATDAATKATEKLKRSQMGFDELNILPGKNSSSSGSGTDTDTPDYGGGIAGGGFELPSTEDLGLDKWQAWFDKYKTLIQDVVTWSLIGVGGLGAVICFFSGNWVGGLKFLALAAAGFAIGNVEGGTFDRLSTDYKNLITDIVAYSLIGVGGLGAVICFLTGNIVGGIKFLGLAGVGVAVGLSGGTFERLIQKLRGLIDGFIKWFKDNMLPFFTKEYWVKQWENIKTAASQKLNEIGKSISDWWNNNIKAWWNKNIAPIFTKDYWMKKWDNIKQGAATKLQETKDAINTRWTQVTEWFNKNVAPKFTSKYWLDKWNNIKTGAATKLDEVKSTISSKWNGIKDWFSKNVSSKFTTSYWKNKFNTVKDGAKGAFNGVIDVVEKAVNGIIKKINTLSWKIPDWVPKLGGKKFGFSFKEIKIPRLATGGIVTKSTIANIGEAGREAVLPLDNNTQWMDTLADKIAARSNTPAKIILQVDGKAFAQASIKSINDLTKSTGKLQLQLV